MTKPKHSSIIQFTDRCWKTGTTQNLDVHHIMNGPFRNKSDEYGLWVYLNHDVHMWLHNTREGKRYEKELKRLAQEKFEEIHGHEKWMQLFKKNYVPDDYEIPSFMR